VAGTLQVSVISPEQVLYEGQASVVTVPAFDGEMGILPLHAPLMTLLGTGTLRVESAQGLRRFNISGGFLQVVDDTVRVVTEQATAEN
jgi:F-type H+-transporting ATPase subunit epsilon